MRTLRGSNAAAVIAVLTPVIRGWAAYYRTVVSSKVFHSLDAYLWRLTFKWAKWRHRNKPRRWIVGRYFGKFNTFRNDHWVFGDRDSGAYLVKFSWTGIRRHVPARARHHLMTPPWPDTGPTGARRSDPHSTGTPCGCWTGSTRGARCAGSTC
jgi:RNA-directed DNA polymerase